MEKNKLNAIDLISNSKRLLTNTQKEKIINWVESGNKPKIKDKCFRSFYLGYSKLRQANKINQALKELKLIK